MNRNIFVTIDNKYRYHYIKKKVVYFPKEYSKTLDYTNVIDHVEIKVDAKQIVD